VALAVGDDPLARQEEVEATAGAYAGERKFGRAANLPSTRPRKPTDADMGPHNWGGGEARPKGGAGMRGGPPPHRHDFEEMFTLLGGELEITFRGETKTLRAGSTINIPANAPHAFRNASGGPAHLLCLAAPAGLDEFFLAVGDPLASRASPPPELDKAQMEERIKTIKALAPKYRTELLIP
jgi:mannose-6-phosphate isomerase-like protein (cupin superfamily)